jgi:transglutaminase-like putative cysteine protease
MPCRPHQTACNRREFIRVAGLGTAALVGGVRPIDAAEIDPSAYALMEFDVSYRTRIHRLPADARDLHLWMPLPSSDTAQHISHLEVESPRRHEITREPLFDSRMLHVAVTEGLADSAPFDVEARYHVTRRRVGTQPDTLADSDAGKYLTLTPTVRMTEEIERFAARVVGRATDPYEIGRRVSDGIQELLFYDKTIPGCGTGDTAWIMKHRRGKCDDYHALYMAIMVSRRVPIRWHQGFPLPLPEPGTSPAAGQLEGDCTGAHCWVSFYAPDHGWVPVDVSEADKLGDGGEFFFGHLSPNRFQVSVGRAVVLTPAQGGSPLASFAYAYAESDGIPLVYTVNYENIIKYTVTNVEMS